MSRFKTLSKLNHIEGLLNRAKRPKRAQRGLTGEVKKEKEGVRLKRKFITTGDKISMTHQNNKIKGNTQIERDAIDYKKQIKDNALILEARQEASLDCKKYEDCIRSDSMNCYICKKKQLKKNAYQDRMYASSYLNDCESVAALPSY